MVVLPFANLTGDAGWDYLAKDMGVELTTLMGAFPNMHVLAGSAPGGADQDVRRAAARAGARYVIAGARRQGKRPAALYGSALRRARAATSCGRRGTTTRASIPKPPGPTSPPAFMTRSRGFWGASTSRRSAGRGARTNGSLDAYDYYLRGASFFLRFTQADNEKARAIFEEGLKKYPNDGLLQVKLAWCFLARTWYSVDENSREDIEQAWAQAQFARTAPSQSHLATYLLHQLMAVSLPISRRRLRAFGRRSEGRHGDGAVRNHDAFGPCR